MAYFELPEKLFITLLVVAVLVTAVGCSSSEPTWREQETSRLSEECFERRIKVSGPCPLYMSEMCSTYRSYCRQWAADVVDRACGGGYLC